MATLERWKAGGRVRYVGISRYTSSACREVAKVLETQRLDFLQINDSAEDRLLPLAGDEDVAVLVNMPFGGGWKRRGGGDSSAGWGGWREHLPLGGL